MITQNFWVVHMPYLRTTNLLYPPLLAFFPASIPCGAGVVISAVTIYADLEAAYLGFGGLTTIIGISMIIYVWIGILGGLIWKKSMSMS